MKIEEAKKFYTGEVDFRTVKVIDNLNPNLRIEIISVGSNLRGPLCRVHGTGWGNPDGVEMFYRWPQLDFARE